MRTLAAALILSSALALGACGDDDESPSGASGSTTSTAAAASKGTYHFVSVADSSGLADFSQGVKLGIDAALSEINGAGGVNGYQLEIDLCKTDSSPDAAATCGRNAAADKKVLASVGGFTLGGKGLIPALEKAKLPSVGDYALDALGAESEIAFPIASVQNGFINAAILPAALLKAKSVDAVVVDAPAGRGAALQIAQVLKAGGTKVKRTLFVPPGAGDLSAQVQTLKGDDVDAIVTIMQDSLTAQLIQSYRQVDPETPLVTTSTAFSPAFIKKLGSNTNNLYIGMQFAVDSPGEKTFQESVEKAGNPEAAGDLARNSYLAVKLLADALSRAKSPTREGLLAALNETTAFDSDGLTPALDYTKAPKLFPRVALRSGVFGKVEDGGVKQLSKDFTPSLPDSAPGQ